MAPKKRSALRISPEQIADYWSTRVDESYLNFYWSEAHERCWRCGTRNSLQRCHIVARTLGGTDGPENLVILCSSCHADSPDVDDPEIMWDWIKAYQAAHPDLFWVQQGIREYEYIYHRTFMDDLAFLVDLGTQVNLDNPVQDMWENAGNLIRHFGMSHTSPATFAGVMRHFLKSKAKSIGATLPDERSPWDNSPLMD